MSVLYSSQYNVATVHCIPEMFGDKAPGSGLETGPGCHPSLCHPERSEGSLRPSSQTLRGVYPERSAWAQGDSHSLQISVYPLVGMGVNSGEGDLNE